MSLEIDHKTSSPFAISPGTFDYVITFRLTVTWFKKIIIKMKIKRYLIETNEL